MRERLTRSDGRHVAARASAERTSRRGEHEPAHLGPLTASQGLRDGRVLRVDRDDLSGARRTTHQITADDQRLLVRQGERRAGRQRGERGSQPHRTGDAVEHDVGLDVVHQLGGLLRSERRVLHAERLRLGGERVARGVSGQTDDVETTRVRADDLERLGADGAGGTENDDAPHAVRLPTPHAWGHSAATACCVPRMSTTNTSVSSCSSFPSLSPYPNSGGMTTSTCEPTVCPSSACWKPATTPVVVKVAGVSRSQLESKTSPSDHFTPA